MKDFADRIALKTTFVTYIDIFSSLTTQKIITFVTKINLYEHIQRLKWIKYYIIEQQFHDSYSNTKFIILSYLMSVSIELSYFSFTLNSSVSYTFK